MVDIGTGLALLGTAQLVQKLLGPTAEYLGEGLRDLTQKRIMNIRRIFEKATTKLGADFDKHGVVPPRVLWGVISEGSFCEDELETDYFSGVLASSRMPEGRENRGATYVKMITRLSNYEIRAHYIFYTVIRKLYAEKYHTFTQDLRSRMRTLIPTEPFVRAMDLDEYQQARDAGVISQCIWGLARENLIENFSYDERNITFSPTVIGAHLYLWAQGKGRHHESYLLDPEQSFPELAGIRVPKGCNFLEDIDAQQ